MISTNFANRPWPAASLPPTKPTPKPPKPRQIQEHELQSAAVKALRRARQAGWPIRVAGDMNAARRTLRETGLAVATGMNAGEPDLRVYLPNGKLLLIEFKRAGKTRGRDGKLTTDQVDAHAELTRLGHDVITLTPATKDEAATLTLDAVSLRLGMPVPERLG